MTRPRPTLILALLLFLHLPAMSSDPLTDAQARFGALHSYQVTLRSTDAAGAQQVIRYFFQKPGWVRMDFEQPHRGAVLIYSPDTRRVHLWPFGLGHWPQLDLAPDNALLRSPGGQRVDRSDVGVLLTDLRLLGERGNATPLGDADLAGRPATVMDVTGPSGGGTRAVQRFRVWLVRDTKFPLRVDSFAADGHLIESVDMSDARIDVPIPERFFTP